ncbi:twin-arginine translocation pathway signal protein, partial [bacterium]|nr:twin-arginine translocation pathway signal protein [bacterium]
DKKTRNITLPTWPRWVNPAQPGAKPYNGWPITINQMDNYGRKAAAFLPEIKVSGMSDPVIQVIDESSGEIVYTIRIEGTSFKPKVFKDGLYTVKVGEPDTEKLKILEHLKSYKENEKKSIEVNF